jgi:drug/metabolite transporter (DMT)-like permease
VNSKPAAGALSANLRSILFMLLACVFFAANDLSTKYAVQFIPVPEIMAVRGLAASLLGIGIVWGLYGIAAFKLIKNRHVFYRSILEALIGPALITCYAFLPIATVTAVMQVGPFFGMIAGIVLFRESVGWRRWLAAIVGFAGVLLIIKPGHYSFEPIALIVLLTSMMTVARDIQSRKIGNAAPPFVVSFATSFTNMTLGFVLTPLLLPFHLRGWGEWVWPDPVTLAVVLLAAVSVVLAHTLSFLAFRAGDMSVVSPFRYFYLLFSLLGGIVIFSEVPDWLAFLGMILIAGGGIYLLHRERLRAKAALASTTAPAGQ